MIKISENKRLISDRSSKVKKNKEKIEKVEKESQAKVKSVEGKVESQRKKIDVLEKQAAQMVKTEVGREKQTQSTKFVIKNLEEGKSENITRKVNGLIRDGIISCQSPSRQQKG